MKKINHTYVLISFALFIFATFMGCAQNENNPVENNPISPTIINAPPTLGDAQLHFQIVFPDRWRKPAPAILATGQATPTVTIKVVLYNIASSSTTVLSKTVEADSNGIAVATFPDLPPLPAVGKFSIFGGNIGGAASFSGSIDLASGKNAMVLSPDGSNATTTIVAYVMEELAKDTTKFASAPRNLVAAINTAISGLSFSASTVYADAKTAFLATLTNLVVGGSAKELIITEIGTTYYSNVPSWIEIYNNSDQAIDLSQYMLRAQSKPSRASSWTWSSQNYPLTLNLPARSYGLLMANVSTTIFPAQRTELIASGGYVFWWQSDGFVELLKAGATIDFVSFGADSTSPTTSGAWSGNPATLIPSSSTDYGKSLSRAKDLADTNSATDWTIKQFSTPGGTNDATNDTDTDRDGIPDVCEAAGATFIGLPLYDWGARPNQTDIFIHLDYMDSTDLGISPRKEALDNVVTAIHGHGYEVHFDIGDLFGTGISNHNLDGKSHKVPFANGMTLGEVTGMANLYRYKASYLDIAKRGIFHYCIFANSQLADGSPSSSTGLGEVSGNDFFLSMGNSNTFSIADQESLFYLINEQAGTLMHELGHNLGLLHGGSDSVNNKPNYRSIMNYLYGYGLPTIGNVREGDRYYHKMWKTSLFSHFSPFYQYFSTSGTKQLHNSPYTNTFVMDYSSGGGGTLDETNLSEGAGLGYSQSAGVDWNGDGDTVDIVSKDINVDGTLGTYSDFNDWGNITIVFSRELNGAQNGFGGKSPPAHHCFAVDDYQAISEKPCGVFLAK